MNTCQYPANTACCEAPATATERPRFQTSEDADGVSLRVALPGVRKEDLKLTLHEASLKIEAARSEAVPETWTPRTAAAATNRYDLSFRLSARLDGTKATASLDSGILTLRVPVREEAKPRQIEVN